MTINDSEAPTRQMSQEEVLDQMLELYRRKQEAVLFQVVEVLQQIRAECYCRAASAPTAEFDPNQSGD